MNWEDASEKILVTMLGQLGFSIEVERENTEDGLCLQIKSEHNKTIIGRNGDRLEDLQYLVNRVLNKHFPDAPRVKVDCAHYRDEQEKKLVEKARVLADRVRADGRSIRTRPLNAYYRRIVHNALMDVEGVSTVSPKGDSRFKRIEIKPA
ncbi:R3H domain-containing protein [Rubritalea squalenifaciens DSM 18772]|uniref:R3H domain-containing protein n=2 Tax=Rubritalea TaxID=361050 RepID=A0A1M6GW06_9BACT|nr:R3H domain-containing nucleic acid-binding protein [Rubritalea squalenifaciens]SHJ14070.1 R3H domain-containing protein [Rubritalea squalenifaciens DSM 18772]